MNWALPELANRALVSFSDAHSAANVGREVTEFEMEPTYDGLMAAIATQSIAETIEFFLENGKYHLDGHRSCGIRLTPSESAELDGKCPTCGKSLTLGVLNRIESLSGEAQTRQANSDGLVRSSGNRPPFRRLVPLRDLVAAVEGVGNNTKIVGRAVDILIEHCGSELFVLINATSRELQNAATDEIAAAIISVRQGDLEIEPGYDGIYGVVSTITD